MGELSRMTQFKDKSQRYENNVTVGLFDYPVLMAADILLYDTDIVPIGKDQKQHLEITQELARIFNNTYGETFKIPQEYVLKEVETLKGLDGQKMSKSYKNTIGLFDTREAITKKVKAIVTDSKRPEEPKDPETCNIFYYHRIFSIDILRELEIRYKEGKISYKESKDILVDNMDKYLTPFRLKKEELDENKKYVLEILRKGKEKASSISSKKLLEIKEKIGMNLK
jgi:tryptophanyl-tRNA synthetase